VDLGFITSGELRSVFGVTGVIALFLWVLSVGLLTNKTLSNPYRFKKVLFIVAILFCIVGYSASHIEPLFTERFPNSGLILAAFTPFVFWGVVYSFYNVSRSLKSLELERKAGFGESIIVALLLFFPPIGVWIIQPQINRIDNMFKE
jgi:hypothetical protein